MSAFRIRGMKPTIVNLIWTQQDLGHYMNKKILFQYYVFHRSGGSLWSTPLMET